MLGDRHTAANERAYARGNGRCQRGIPYRACGILGALATRMAGIDMPHHQGHLKRRTQTLAMHDKAVGRRLQAVVHVNGGHLPGPPAGTADQQRGGICAAAQRDGQRQRRRKGVQRLVGRKRRAGFTC